MASHQQPSKKRRLPAWMKAVGGDNVKFTKRDITTSGSTSSSGEGNSNSESGSLCTGAKQSKSEKVLQSDFISETMPFLSFPGTVVYCNSFADCSCYCEELLSTYCDFNSSVEGEGDDIKIPVGFDMEWPVTYNKGAVSKTALIQMCFSEEKCYLFHLSAIGNLPKLLIALICDQNLVLVGLNIVTDMWKLERDFDVRVKPLLDRGSVVDVGKLANVKLKSSENWSLDGLCKNVLKLRLNKQHAVRCGSWTDIPLSSIQKDYAVTDAYAGLKLYNELSRKQSK